MGQEELGDVSLLPETDSTAANLHSSDKKDNKGDDLNGNRDLCSKDPADVAVSKASIIEKLVCPPSHLPQPEVPAGLMRFPSASVENYHAIDRSKSLTSYADMDMSSFGKFIRDRGNSFSAAIAKRISYLKESDIPATSVTEFHLSDLKVIVRLKDEEDGSGAGDYDGIKGRISFFSRSGCRDCGAVRSFFQSKGLPFVEINIDVFMEREKELISRTGCNAVPAIFFNERLVGGLVALNSLRNSGEFECRLREMAGRRCPDGAPRVPVYGFDDEEEAKDRGEDAMVVVIRILRQRLPIQDRITKMKLVKNCFAGSDMVEVLIHQLDCGRQKAVEIGKYLAQRHFIHHVFRENYFEDSSNQFYRFLEHDPSIPKCFNFRVITNDYDTKPAIVVSNRLTKLMSAILEAYSDEDHRLLDYARIGSSEEFRRYTNAVQDLQRLDISGLSTEERTAFFLNLYNAMVIHANVRIGCPGTIDRRSFFNDFQYIVGGYTYSPLSIKDGILRSNSRSPYSFVKRFSSSDRRLGLVLPKVNPLIHFGLCNGARSSPRVRFFSVQGVEAELRHAAREFLSVGGIEVDLEKRVVHLTRIIKWYSADFGVDKDILHWLLGYLDANKTGLLTHLMSDGGPVNIVYQMFDWSMNS